MSPNTPHIALCISIRSTYGREIVHGIIDYSHQHGPWNIVHEEGWPVLDTEEFTSLRGRQLDGVIANLHTEEQEQILREAPFPFVNVSAFLKDSPEQVIPDNLEIGRMTADHFLERGFRSFAFCGRSGIHLNRLRGDGFRQRLAEAEFTCHDFQSEGFLPPADRPAMEKDLGALKSWLEQLQKPVGVFAATDTRGRQVIEIAHELGFLVPDEVAVVGVDNDELICNLPVPHLSSVVLKTERIGYEASALLARRMAGHPPPGNPVLIPPLRVATRQSSEILAVDDPELRTALRYIREHAAEAIRVKDILVATGIPRRALERRFRSLLGSSPGEELVKIRISMAKRFLAESEDSVAAIAEKCGFNSLPYMSEVFGKKTGHSPLAYRARFRNRRR